MQRFLGGLVLALIFIALTGTKGEAAEYKIGYINTQKIIRQSEQAQKALENLKSTVSKHKSELKDLEERIKELRGDLKREGALMSKEQRETKQSELQKKIRRFQRRGQAAQQKLSSKKQQVLKEIYQDIAKIVNRIGQQEGFDLILTEPAAMYVTNQMDLTARVLEELNSQSTP